MATYSARPTISESATHKQFTGILKPPTSEDHHVVEVIHDMSIASLTTNLCRFKISRQTNATALTPEKLNSRSPAQTANAGVTKYGVGENPTNIIVAYAYRTLGTGFQPAPAWSPPRPRYPLITQEGLSSPNGLEIGTDFDAPSTAKNIDNRPFFIVANQASDLYRESSRRRSRNPHFWIFGRQGNNFTTTPAAAGNGSPFRFDKIFLIPTLWNPLLLGTQGGEIYPLALYNAGTFFTQELTDIIALVDSIAKFPQKVASEIITLVDTVLKSTNRALTEAVILVDTILKQPQKVLTEAIVLVDSIITKITAIIKTEAVVLVDTLAKSTTRLFTEAVVLVDTALKEARKTFSEAIVLVDTIQNLFGKVFTEAIVLVDSITKSTTKVLTDVATLVDTIAKRTERALTDVVVLVDQIRFGYFRIFTEVAMLVDTIRNIPGKVFTETIVLVDSIMRSTSKAFTDALVLVDTMTRSATRTLTDAITLADSVLKQMIKGAFQEAVVLVDTINKQTRKALSDIVTLVDTATRATGKLAGETIALVDGILKSTTRAFIEQITLVDVVTALTTTIVSIGKFIVRGIYLAGYTAKTYLASFTLRSPKDGHALKDATRTFTLREKPASATIRVNKPEP